MSKKLSHFFPYTNLLIILAVFALFSMGLRCLVIETVTFRSIDQNEPATQIAAPYIREVSSPQKITVDLLYRGYGTTFIETKSRFCFLQGFWLNDVYHAFPDKKNEWCNELIVDLKEWLHPGHNTLSFIATNDLDESGIAIGSPLFGKDIILSGLTVLFISSLLTVFWQMLARQGYDRVTCFIFVAACGCYLQWLHVMDPFSYAQDLERHVRYIQYVSEHFFHPYGYDGPEHFHPPLYYWLCALVAKGAGFLGVFDVWTGIRLMSVVCYIVFLYFGMRVMAQRLQGYTFYLAFALLLFWPAGVINATRINNDVLLYPLSAACFYYTLVWYDTLKAQMLSKALLFCGLAFMAKTSAVVPASILGANILYKLVTRQCTIRNLINKESFVGWLGFAAGIAFNQIRAISNLVASPQSFSSAGALMGGKGDYQPSLENFFSFDIGKLLRDPFWRGPSDTSIWICHIKALLFNNAWWRYHIIASCMHALYLMMLAYIILHIFNALIRKDMRNFPLIAGTILSFVASDAFLFVGGMHSCTDIHYIWPVVMFIITIFMLAVQEAKSKDWLVFYYVGNEIAIFFIMMAIASIQLQLL